MASSNMRVACWGVVGMGASMELGMKVGCIANIA